MLPLRRFLFLVACQTEGLSFGPADIMTWDLTGTDVFRERDNIDLLLVNNLERFVIVIENKIDAGESATQLGRYTTKVEEDYRGLHKLYVFLTPDGAEPRETAFQAVGYQLIVQFAGRAADPAS